MMNFVEAAKTSIPRKGCLDHINDQALTELRRPLTKSEVDNLAKNFTSVQLMKDIKEVSSYRLYYPLTISTSFLYFSMDMDI